MTAEVAIKVDDSKLSTQLNKARSAVTKTVDRIKSSFRKMGASFKAVFQKMVHYAKWGALAIAGALAFATKAAMKQQDAVFMLSSALKISGEYTKELEARFRAFASSIQQATIYGDEEVLALMQLQKSLGVTADKLEEATKMSIGLATATGRDVKSMAMYISLAQQGEFTMLRRYIPALRTTTDKTEQLRIITEFAAAGFKLAEERAKTASGGLKQMWNALGDVAEVIGAALLPGIQNTAKAIKEWAERNQEKIGRWSETVAVYLSYAKDVLWIFVKFLQTDWKAGIKVGLDISIELFKGFGEVLLVLIKDISKRAAHAFTESFAVGIAKGIAGAKQKIDMLVMGAGYTKWAQKRAVIKPEHFKETPYEGADISGELAQIALETSERIEGMIPPELGTSFEEAATKLKNNLEDVRTVAEEMPDPMEEALVKPIKKASMAMDEASVKMKQWASNAKNIWNNLADVAVGALDGITNALANLALKGKADFKALAQSILMDMTRMIIKAQIAKALGVALPGTFGGGGAGAGGGGSGIPGLQHGGVVAKTGLAVVHKGESFSGVQGGGARQEAVTLNMNVNAIDAAGTYQFLSRNKRAIATMMQGMLTANHPLRRSRTGWK